MSPEPHSIAHDVALLMHFVLLHETLAMLPWHLMHSAEALLPSTDVLLQLSLSTQVTTQVWPDAHVIVLPPQPFVVPMH